MAIKSPHEATMDDIRVRILIAGFPGIGKSTLGLSAPKPLHIDVDRGITRVSAPYRKDYIHPQSYDELLTDLTPANLSDYESLVFDTGGQLLELMKPWAIRQSSQNGQKDGSTLSMKGYGAVGREFQRLMNHAYYDLNKHIVVLFHAKEDRDGDATKLRIMVEGQTKDNVWQPMELGGFMEMFGQRRTMGFSNCERYFAKGTHGISGTRDIPDLSGGVPNDFLTQLFAEVNKNIRDEAAIFAPIQEEYDRIMALYAPQIEAMTSETVGEVSDAIKDAPQALTSTKELKAMLSAKIKQLGMRWDKEARQYVKVSADGNAA